MDVVIILNEMLKCNTLHVVMQKNTQISHAGNWNTTFSF